MTRSLVGSAETTVAMLEKFEKAGAVGNMGNIRGRIEETVDDVHTTLKLNSRYLIANRAF